MLNFLLKIIGNSSIFLQNLIEIHKLPLNFPSNSIEHSLVFPQNFIENLMFSVNYFVYLFIFVSVHRYFLGLHWLFFNLPLIALWTFCFVGVFFLVALSKSVWFNVFPSWLRNDFNNLTTINPPKTSYRTCWRWLRARERSFLCCFIIDP